MAGAECGDAGRDDEMVRCRCLPALGNMVEQGIAAHRLINPLPFFQLLPAFLRDDQEEAVGILPVAGQVNALRLRLHQVG